MTRWRRSRTGQPVDGLAPVTASALVARPPDWAFEWFTNRAGRWWPASACSLDPGHALGLRFEDGPGGRLVEVRDDGTEHVWATTVGWRPPTALSWCWAAHVGGGTTEVDVTFEPAGSGSTWLRLEHRGWAGLGDAAAGARSSYREGWPVILGAYLDAL